MTRTVKFFVSGFGPFMGVDRNPTQSLVEYLAGPGAMAIPSSGCEGEKIQIIGTAVMRVSAEDVDAHLAELVAVLQAADNAPASAPTTTPAVAPAAAATAAAAGSLSAPSSANASADDCASSPSSSSIVLLHLGVANTATAFRLESRAYNCATFRVPDANGWSPQRQELEPGQPGGLEGWVGSALPLQEMAEALTSKGHGDVVVSTDAGRFICNWCYYRSCRHVMQMYEQQMQQHSVQPAVQPVQPNSPVAAPPPVPLDSSDCGANRVGGSTAGGGAHTDASGAGFATAASSAAAASAAVDINSASGSDSNGAAAGRRCAWRRWHSLFIHVPPFSVYDEATQRAFLIDAIREVSARVAAYDDRLDDVLEPQIRQRAAAAGSGGDVGVAPAVTAAAAAEGASGGSVWRPSVVQGTGLPEPSPEQQQRLSLNAAAVATAEDPSAGGGDGVGMVLGMMTDRS